ncbi:MAG: hypothetical protein JWP03_1924 [Phycisphaerales bacterium]|nr:hypothetical protein [Phycisphaerales bacterium]
MRPRALHILFFLAIPLWAMGCANTVYPPAHVQEPVSVFVTNYGFHSAIMLPDLPATDGRYVEYAFGDWGYCAGNRSHPQDAVGALLASWGSAFGRRYVTFKPGQEYPVPKVSLPKNAFAVTVTRARAQRVVNALNARWELHAKTAVHIDSNDVTYVKDPAHYGIFNSCNRFTADTLKELDCEVDGPAIVSKFHPGCPTPPIRAVAASQPK